MKNIEVDKIRKEVRGMTKLVRQYDGKGGYYTEPDGTTFESVGYNRAIRDVLDMLVKYYE